MQSAYEQARVMQTTGCATCSCFWLSRLWSLVGHQGHINCVRSVWTIGINLYGAPTSTTRLTGRMHAPLYIQLYSSLMFDSWYQEHQVCDLKLEHFPLHLSSCQQFFSKLMACFGVCHSCIHLYDLVSFLAKNSIAISSCDSSEFTLLNALKSSTWKNQHER